VIGDFAAAQQPVSVQPPPPAQPAPDTQTGRLMFGVGVNSDAGLTGGVTLPGGNTSGSSAAPAAATTTPPQGPGVAGEGGQPGNEPAYTVAKPEFETRARQPAVATGLASLDFELPTRGALYRFTTPRGEVEVTARTVSKGLLQRLIEIAVVLAVVLVAWYASRLIGAGPFGWFAGRTGSTLLICLGALSFCGGALPVLGLAALVTGCGLKVHRRMGLPAKIRA
jgi:hypothetical protein